ncbi:MAG: hypothetical protein QOJ13_2178 [Gaiellales bacterium]|jgi:hypothetical protein|nr:hypothetical protein [Gaiellales bacterium]
MSNRLYRRTAIAGAIAAVTLAASCGGTNASTTPTGPAPSGSTQTSGGSSGSSGGANALVGEANAAAAGDIPDNQAFLTFDNKAEGYSITYPEGWTQQGGGASVTFRDKNNEMRILTEAGAVSLSAVQADLQRLTAQTKGFKVVSPPVGHPTCTNAGTTIQLPLVAAKVVYETVSMPNSVTGKAVTLVVDRYYLSHNGKRAIVDLASPKGVDNVDAFCLMTSSFKWK